MKRLLLALLLLPTLAWGSEITLSIGGVTGEYAKVGATYLTADAPVRYVSLVLAENTALLMQVDVENPAFNHLSVYRSPNGSHNWRVLAWTGDNSYHSGAILKLYVAGTANGAIEFVDDCDVGYVIGEGNVTYQTSKCGGAAHKLSYNDGAITVPAPSTEDAMVLTSDGQSVPVGQEVQITATYTTGKSHLGWDAATAGVGVFLEYDSDVWEPQGQVVHPDLANDGWTFYTQLTPAPDPNGLQDPNNDASRYVEVWKNGIYWYAGTKGVAVFTFKVRSGQCGKTTLFGIHPLPVMVGSYRTKTQSVVFNLVNLVSKNAGDVVGSLNAINRTNVTVTTRGCTGGECDRIPCEYDKVLTAPTTWSIVKELYR